MKRVSVAEIHNQSINVPGRELFLHCDTGGSGEEPGLSYREGTQFIKNMAILNSISHAPILVHLHSIGGEWRDGIAIYDTIKASPSPVIMLGYADVRSMSSVILQAAKVRVLMPHTSFMIHRGELSVCGEELTVESDVQWARLIVYPAMLQIYAERCRHSRFYAGIPSPNIALSIRTSILEHGNWWLTAEDAVTHGFADGVLGTKGYETVAKIMKRAGGLR